MTIRVATSEFAPRPSAKVKTVAEMLDADPAIVRRLVDKGELESHTIGKRGVRIYLDSVADYQDRQMRQIAKRETRSEKRERRQSTRAAARAAIAGLKAWGVRL